MRRQLYQVGGVKSVTMMIVTSPIVTSDIATKIVEVETMTVIEMRAGREVHGNLMITGNVLIVID